ncbi:MAG: M20 family metallopeptidase [Firmicutes bacterium]|nr:M20 family metallopeptidase [Bacillota bacterium]
MKKRVISLIDNLENELIKLSEFIYNNPELGFKEYKSSKAHMDLLKKYNFKVESKFMGIETAFKAEFDSKKKGPTIAFLSEYDALPKIGHGCGHNLLGTTSTGAGIVLSKILNDIGGKVIVFGTPAEETSGGKVQMALKGAFDNIDIALIAHPGDKYYKSGSSLAMEAIKFEFKGKSAHAAAYPEKGINALDAAINTFNNINALREHIRYDSRIHGIIKKGGEAANIVPDLAVAEFYVRAITKSYLISLSKRVKNCAKGASLAAGCELEISNYEASYDNLITNETLSNIFTKNIKSMGVKKVYDSRESYGSLDMGNVSQVCPSIHPYFSITDKEVIAHTKEFSKETIKPKAYNGMKKTIGALVLTAIDVIKDKDLLKDIKEEFNKKK